MAPVALVTGAASGIGAAVAALLTERGWTVAGLDLRPAEELAAAFGVGVPDPAKVPRTEWTTGAQV